MLRKRITYQGKAQRLVVIIIIYCHFWCMLNLLAFMKKGNAQQNLQNLSVCKVIYSCYNFDLEHWLSANTHTTTFIINETVILSISIIIHSVLIAPDSFQIPIWNAILSKYSCNIESIITGCNNVWIAIYADFWYYMREIFIVASSF